MKSVFISRVLAVKLIWVSTGLQLECETHDVQAKYRQGDWGMIVKDQSLHHIGLDLVGKS